MTERQKVIVIVGPTASGKSALAVEIARQFSGEVISADSRQVYKGLDIGTGKITKREMKKIPHYLLDVVHPKKIFTAYDFTRHARRACTNILQNGKVPIICGGTGFYIDVLLGRISLPDVSANMKLRAHLEKKSTSELYRMLKKLDPRRARVTDRHNPVRLVRALEIAKSDHKTTILTTHTGYESFWIGLQPDAVTLRKKIHLRLLERMRAGMVQEAKRLHVSGLSWKRMEALGLEYRHLALYLQKKISKEAMLRELEARIWHYAKRQITYWKRNKDITWFAPSNKKDIVRKVKDFLG